MAHRPQHPSGRPVRQTPRPKKSEPVWHCPLEQPATPRLRTPDKAATQAIGFYSKIAQDDQ